MKHTNSYGATGLIVVLAASLLPLAPCNADTFDVTNTDGGTGAGTFYAALESAVTSGPGPHTILATGISGKIVLEQDLPVVTTQVHIVGPGAANLSLQSGASRRAFSVMWPGELTVERLTFLQCGFSASVPHGGAISNIGELSLSDCVFDRCGADHGGAIHSLGSLEIKRCAFLRCGALNYAGALNIVGGPADIEACTFYENVSGLRGGAIRVDGNLTECRISWTTVFGNDSEDGGGLYNEAGASTSIENCIFASNRDSVTDEANDIFGEVVRSRHNFVGGDPQLRPLSAYGGDIPYLLPRISSPVLRAADPAGLGGSELDTRGVARGTGAVDLGAVETQIYFVESGAGSAADPDQTLHNAMVAAAGSAVDYIDLRALEDPITLTDPLPLLTGRAIIFGNPRQGIFGGSIMRLFEVADTGHLVLEGLLLAGGHADEANGGAILNSGTTIIRRCSFESNTASCAGAIRNQPGAELEIYGSSFSLCRATNDSGAVENVGGRCVIVNSTFESNYAGDNGGAISNFGSGARLRVDHCTICRNRASNNGDGIYIAGGDAYITRDR